MITRKQPQLQFRANFEGWCKAVAAPPAEVFRLFEDRLLFDYTVDWKVWLDAHCSVWNAGIDDHNPTGADFPTAVCGWREDSPWCAAQFILHDDGEMAFMGVDFDYGNPSQGLAPAFLHGCEWAWNKATRNKTGPYAVRRWLGRRGIKVQKM